MEVAPDLVRATWRTESGDNPGHGEEVPVSAPTTTRTVDMFFFFFIVMIDGVRCGFSILQRVFSVWAIVNGSTSFQPPLGTL